MKNELLIPVFTEPDRDDSIGEPASIRDTIKRVLGKSICVLQIDEETLNQCVSAAANLLYQLDKMSTQSSKVKTDSITFQLGVSSTGKVALIGSGVDIELATTIQVTFKVT
jgi:hypothetical protein